MQTATQSVHTLKIDGMNGDTCIKKVTHALKEVKGITTKSVKVGSATIDANEEGCKSACTAISAVGFKTREAKAGLEPTGAPLKVNSGVAGAKPAPKKH